MRRLIMDGKDVEVMAVSMGAMVWVGLQWSRGWSKLAALRRDWQEVAAVVGFAAAGVGARWVSALGILRRRSWSCVDDGRLEFWDVGLICR